MDFNWDELQRNYKPMTPTIKSGKKPVKKSFLQDNISTGGGIGGAAAGGITGAALGSVVPGVGTVIGGLAGAILGGFGGGAAGQYIENGVVGEEDMSKDVLKEGALNAAFSLGPIRGANMALQGGKALARGTGVKTALETAATATPIRNAIAGKFGQKLQQGGANLLGSQANLTRAETRKLGPGGAPADVLGGINKTTGLSSIDNMANVGSNVTGSNGVLSELTRNAIGNSKGVDIGDLRTVADDLLTDYAPNVVGGARNNVLKQVQANVVKAYGGSKGSLDPLGAPIDSFDVARSFENMAADLKNVATPTTADKQLAKVYEKLANHVKDKLYATPGVDEGVSLAKTEAVNKFRQLAQSSTNNAEKNAYNRLADQTEQMTNIAQIRKAQAPFVKLGKIDEATARSQAGAGAQFGDQMQGLGRYVQKPLNMVAAPLNAATPRVGGAMANIGSKLAGVGGGVSNPISSIALGGRMGLAGALTNPGTPQENVAPMEDMVYQGEEQPTSLDQALLGAQEQSNPFGVSKEQIAQNMMMALQQGDKEGFSQLKTMYELVSDYEAQGQGGGSDLTSQQATLMAKNQTAASSLDRLEQLYNSAGGGGVIQGNIAGLAGNLNLNSSAKTYNDNIASAARFLGRAMGETGAGSDADAAAFIDKMPKLTDSPEVARMKLAELRQLLADSRQNMMYYGGGVSSLEDSLLAQ